MSRSPVEVVHGPVITEKAYSLYQSGRYTFKVAKHATKSEIARALEEHYADQGIKVVAVNTIAMRGKTRRSGQRGVSGRTPNWKKAVVTLGPGQRLEGLFGSL
ncbi:MAG: 50S ribosomal protein L23 [bacterium]|jgi:large subunit ribosomal protein L23|nr:50S ribosomal protein L23 [bacterium]